MKFAHIILILIYTIILTVYIVFINQNNKNLMFIAACLLKYWMQLLILYLLISLFSSYLQVLYGCMINRFLLVMAAIIPIFISIYFIREYYIKSKNQRIMAIRNLEEVLDFPNKTILFIITLVMSIFVWFLRELVTPIDSFSQLLFLRVTLRFYTYITKNKNYLQTLNEFFFIRFVVIPKLVTIRKSKLVVFLDKTFFYFMFTYIIIMGVLVGFINGSLFIPILEYKIEITFLYIVVFFVYTITKFFFYNRKLKWFNTFNKKQKYVLIYQQFLIENRYYNICGTFIKHPWYLKKLNTYFRYMK